MRIAISGTSCQGKTTLINDFLKEWPTYNTPSKTYRDYLTENNLPHSSKTNKHTQWGILNFLIDDLQQYDKTDNVIFDRCPLDNIIYSLWAYEKNINDIDDDFINKCIPVVRESLKMLDVIFLIPITKAAPVKVVDDNLRDTDKVYIKEVDNLFKGVERQYLEGQKASPFLPNEECPAIIEIFGTPEQRIHMIRQYLDVDGDVIGETENMVLGEEVLDMEQIIKDQQLEMKKDKIQKDELFQRILNSKNN